MDKKVCMITGANRGIGKATALGLAKMGSTVVMVCRNRELGEAAKDEIKAESGNTAVDLMVADLSSQASIRQLANDFGERNGRLNVLINNAGISRTKRYVTEDGIELAFAINYLAPFLLSNLLLEDLKASAPARIVNVAGDYHRKATINFDDLMSELDYDRSMSTNQAKLALILFSFEIARRLNGTGVTVNYLRPGATATDPIKNDPVASAVEGLLYKLVRPIFASGKRRGDIYLPGFCGRG
jgi:NAD(P)-dependent dehydrogenase (short-subunit alcohol dehydrogenase family)